MIIIYCSSHSFFPKLWDSTFCEDTIKFVVVAVFRVKLAWPVSLIFLPFVLEQNLWG